MNTIKCQKCGTEISLTEVMQKQAEELAIVQKESVMQDLNIEIENIKQQKNQLRLEKEQLANTVKEKLEKEKSILTKNIQKEIDSSMKIKIDFLETQVKNSDQKLNEAVEKEISVRKKILEIEQKEREIALTIEDQVAIKNKQATEQITKKIAEDYKRKDQERESQAAELRKQIVEWKQKAEQGSQQLQGELLELQLEEQLKNAFPQDRFEPVPKGVNGADLIQNVIGAAGQRYGKIVIEMKRTKNYNPAWIAKLKEDRNNTKGDIAVLVSEVLPTEDKDILEIDGIWVCKPSMAIVVVHLLRTVLKDVARATISVVGRTEKAEVVYTYLTNATFRQRMETIVESFVTMRDDLEKEKRAIQRNWKVREASLEKVFTASLGICTDVQSMLGQATFQIKALEFPSELITIDE